MIIEQLMAAALEPVVLAILAQGESYGYEMIQRVHALSGGKITWTDDMLHPVLQRLNTQGLIDSEWRTAENGLKRRYFSISSTGRIQLNAMREQWQCVSSMLTQLRKSKTYPT